MCSKDNAVLNTSSFTNVEIIGVGVIQAEEYKDMIGITVEVTADVSGDSNVTSIDATDWMEYQLVTTKSYPKSKFL